MSTLPSPFLVLSILCALLSFAMFAGSVVKLKKRKIFGTTVEVTFALLLLALAALFGTITVGLQGYRSLTKEEVAARVATQPTGDQRFIATFQFPDGQTEVFDLAGDELYVDAHILKWKSVANLLGLHTEYELDRVAGRYRSLEDEQLKERTVFSLATERAIDLFELRRRFSRLSALVDADYGSATFIPTKEPSSFEVRVSTTGLLIRPLEMEPQTSSTGAVEQR